MIENSNIHTHTDIQVTNPSPTNMLVQTGKDVFVKCNRCHTLLYVRTWQKHLKVCDVCGYHFRLSAPERIAYLMDADSFVESETEMQSSDPLTFIGQPRTYAEKLVEEQMRTALHEAVVIGSGRIATFPLVLAVMDFRFIGGSMGTVVGEKIARAAELACEKRIPLLIIAASGGARMQEGIFSLMQMAKVSVVLARMGDTGLPCISLLTDPTTGGVAASFGMQGDIILAEPGTLVGFAGPRVIEQFIHQKLPDDADTAEFTLNHGMIDAVVPRPELRTILARLLRHYHKRNIAGATGDSGVAIESNPCCEELERTYVKPTFTSSKLPLSSWEQVQIARHTDRPYTADYIRLIGENFQELRGDRRYADDQAVIGGLLTFAGRTVMLIGHQKGRDHAQRLRYGFGMPHPEGYRKAQRLMRHAEKFAFPVICLIDTPGAFPGLEAEQRGQAQAIAESLTIMSMLRVPTVAVVIGEGGSGGALAFGLADRVMMMEHSIYTVASPEAAASILWRDNKLASQAAEAMRISAHELLSLGVIDAVIPEPEGGAHLDHERSGEQLAWHLRHSLDELEKIPLPTLLSQRHTKFRNVDLFQLYPEGTKRTIA